MGKNVLLVTPNNKARDELVKRCKKLYGMTINNNDKTYDGNLDCFISAGLLHSKKVTDETLRKQFIEQLNKYDVVMADEVEYTINPSGKFIYDHCINARNFYGFSGTSDKQAGESISFINGLSDIVLRNKDMVSYFGPTLVYRMPVNRTIHNIKIQTDSMDRIPFDWDSVEKSGNAYNEIMQQIWTNDGVVKSIIKVVEAYPMCFIPLNNLNYIIKDWIENYFRGKLKTLLISSAGYGGKGVAVKIIINTPSSAHPCREDDRNVKLNYVDPDPTPTKMPESQTAKIYSGFVIQRAIIT